MDRTNAITRLNTEEIANEVNNVIKKGLDKLLSDHLCRYELLEKTHDAIMNLPSVRHHLNLSQREPFIKKEDVTKDFDTKYGKMIEKLLNRIDELTDEVNQLKQSCKPTHVEVVKLEQKENIKLEIEDAESEIEDQSEEDAENEIEAESEIEDIIDSEEEYEENICSECDCKVILKEDIIIVDGKNYCGACDPNSCEAEEAEEEASASLEAEEEASSCEAEEEAVASSCEAEEAEEAEADEAVASLEAEEAEEEEVETEASETEAEEEEEEYIEIDIDDVTYCTNNEENGFIYELTEDGDVGNKIGYLKDGEPFFYADEK